MASDVYYKLMDGKETIKGGQLHRGFNSVSLQAKKLFREPAAFPYVLEFKAGDLIVRRELIIGVQMDFLGLLGKPAEGMGSDDYILEMFFGQELLASSRKTIITAQELGIEVRKCRSLYAFERSRRHHRGPGQGVPRAPGDTLPLLFTDRSARPDRPTLIHGK